MASSCSSRIQNSAVSNTLNLTELLMQRYEHSPKDDWDRLFKCWGYEDCGDCHRSEGFCGWCALTSSCLPLPTDPLSKAFPLLTPLRYKYLCPEIGERFELRTSGLGCQVSTITFLTSIVTIFCTLFGVLVLYAMLKCAKWIGLGARARRGGYVLYPSGNDELQGDIWVRKSESWGKWWRRISGQQKELEIEEVDEGTPARGWVWWGRGIGKQPGVPESRTPLLRGE